MTETSGVSEDSAAKALALKQRGNDLYKKKKYSEAIALYSEAIDFDPQPAYYGNRAAAYILDRQFDLAAADADTSIRIDPTFKKGYLRGTKARTSLGQLEEAKALCEEGLKRWKKDRQFKEMRLTLTRVQNTVNRVHEMLFQLEENYKLPSFREATDPKSAAYSKRTQTLSDSSMAESKEDADGDAEMADGSSAASAADSSGFKKTAEVWVISEDEKRDMSRALSLTQRILAIDCQASLPLRATEVRLELAKQDYVRALSLATTAMRFHSKHIPFILLRGISLYKTENMDSARKHFQQVLRRDPDSKEAKTWFKLVKEVQRSKEAGNVAWKGGRLNEAFEKWDACIMADPTNHNLNSKVLCNIAAIWLKKKLWQKAFVDASASLSLDGTYAKAYVRRSQALVQLARWSEAVTDAERACELQSGDRSFKENLRFCKLELKKSKRKDYYKLLGVEKSADERMLAKGFKKQAMKWHPDRYSTATDEERAKAEAHFKELGEAYEVLKDPKMRRQYDSGQDLEEIKQSGHNPFASGGIDISQLFGMMGGMGGMRGGGGGGRGAPGGFTFRFG